MPLNACLQDWSRRRVWLIGASAGIGEALSAALHAQGAQLAVSARGTQGLRALASRCPGVECVPLDLTRPDDFGDAVTRVEDMLGGIDLVIFSAGAYAPGAAPDLDLTSARATLETNVVATISAVLQVLPHLQRGSGIVLTGSVAGYRGLPRAGVYGASKAAVNNFAETLYLDLKSRGISVYLANPGFVDTRLTRQNDFYMPALITPERATQYLLKGLARGRFEIHFPRRFTWLVKLLRLLPTSLYLRLASWGGRDETVD